MTDHSKLVFVIGTTNVPHLIDEAVLRRFSKKVMVPLPDQSARAHQFNNFFQKHSAISEVSHDIIEKTASETEGYTWYAETNQSYQAATANEFFQC
jgi:fidgetin-like protein 1